MNEKQAALKMFILWAWLENHPEKEEEDYPLFRELGFHKMTENCPWCHKYHDGGMRGYMNHAYDMAQSPACGDCPLNRGKNCCTYFYSDYSMYAGTVRLVDRAIRAGNIAHIAWEDYKRLNG